MTIDRLTDLLDAAEAADAQDSTETAPAAAPAPPTPAPAKDEAEEDEAAAPPDPPPAAAPAPQAGDELFTDEALSTKAGVIAARDALRAERKAFARDRDGKFLQLKQRTERLRAKQEKFAAEERKRDEAEVRRRKLRDEGAPSQVIEALAEWYGVADGLEALERLNMAVAGKRKDPDKTDALAAEIRDLKAQLAKEKQGQTEAQRKQLIASRTQDLLVLAQTMPRAKLFIERSPEDAGERLVRYVVESHQAGRLITDQQAAEKLEAWCEKMGIGPAPGQAGSGEAEKLGTAKTKSKSLTSSQVASQGVTKSLSWDEYLTDENARSILDELL